MRRGLSIKTIKKLFAASGGICAFPGCNTRLQDSLSGALLGDICHIHAISKDGPRYTPAQSDDDPNKFETNNINVEFQNFKHPIYPQLFMQHGFIEGLSYLDTLFNIGAKSLRGLLCN